MESSGNEIKDERNGEGGPQRQRGGHQSTPAASFQPPPPSSFHFPQQNGGGIHPASMGGSAFGGTPNAPHPHQMAPEALSSMQAFANLGLFGHQQFSSSIVPAPAVPPHLAAAAAAAYGQRLIGVPGQNGSSAAQLVRRNLVPGHGPPSCSAPPVHSTSSSSSSINRSQRCGVCRGCQCKPCGQCTYCQDSPQFGGPGVKKQSCIERRCLRVLENRLQRDAPTFKARIGCNGCEDCRSPDCQICLVCLDRRFFNCKYMAGALCAKKRCNNATAMELPISVERTSLKRPSDGGGGGPSPHQNQQQMAAKRQILAQSAPAHHHPTLVAQHQLNTNIARILSAANDGTVGQQQQQKFGRSSVGGNNSNSTNSPLSECGGGIPPQSASPPPSSLQMPMSVAQLGRPFWGPSQMLGCLPGQYHFDQMASLAAAAAVGFPQHQVAANYPNPYQPKFLNYPKYEYFSAEEGPPGATMANGPSSIADHPNGIGPDGQMGGGGQSGGGGGGAVPDNLLVPPSYSDVQKVVLQPL